MVLGIHVCVCANAVRSIKFMHSVCEFIHFIISSNFFCFNHNFAYPFNVDYENFKKLSHHNFKMGLFFSVTVAMPPHGELSIWGIMSFLFAWFIFRN